ncbi:hypothetical protein DSM92_25405, partial [Salmonella enterica subsp. enterica]|nr:hypothetical protein [Salmonella enterica subsp. enterica serovar Oranienburg]MLY18351.1 hypothetical protein [Salmonella enterica subsp. enterica serovar Oranienburg]
MAVENKFKLNFIAASVLMGLSLSAVASVPAQDSGSKTSETKPAVTKTLAEAVKAVNPTEVTFDKGDTENPSQAQDLAGLINYMGLETSKRDEITKSVSYAHGKLLGTYNTAPEGTEKAAALQSLVAFNRATAEQMVKGDTAALNKAVENSQKEVSKAQDSISQELKGLSEADSKARDVYDKAIADFLKKSSDEQSSEQGTLMSTLTAQGGPLISGTTFTQISADGGGFKTYDELLESAGKSGTNVLTSHKALL